MTHQKPHSYTATELIEKSKHDEGIELFPEPGYEVIDNFISEDALKRIQSLMIYDTTFPWFRSHSVAWPGSVKDDVTPEHLSYFGHIFYGNYNKRDRAANSALSEWFEEFYKILLGSFNIRSLLRMKGNLYPYTETLWEHAPHTDYNYSHVLAVFYVNTCDGYTKLHDGTKIDSIENRMLLIDGSKLHSSTTTTNAKVRITIGMNWL